MNVCFPTTFVGWAAAIRAVAVDAQHFAVLAGRRRFNTRGAHWRKEKKHS